MSNLDDLISGIQNLNLDNKIENCNKMAIPITSVEINIIPKFSGDSRELPLFLELANNLYTRYLQNDNVPQSFLLDCIKSRLEGEPLRIIASRGLNTKDGIFQALREMYSDPRSECTLELDVTNFIPKSKNLISIGNEIRELISFYDSKLQMNALYTEQMRHVKSQVFRQMALQAFLKSIMLINVRLGDYLLSKEIQTLDQAITLARNQEEWLMQFDKYSRVNKIPVTNSVQRPSLPRVTANVPNTPNNSQYIQNNAPLVYPNYNQSPNYYQNQSSNYYQNQSPNYYQNQSPNYYQNQGPKLSSNKNTNIPNTSQPMDVDPSNSRMRVPPQRSIQNFGGYSKRPLMGFANGRRVFQQETNDVNELESEYEEVEQSNQEVTFEENFQVDASRNHPS